MQEEGGPEEVAGLLLRGRALAILSWWGALEAPKKLGPRERYPSRNPTLNLGAFPPFLVYPNLLTLLVELRGIEPLTS